MASSYNIIMVLIGGILVSGVLDNKALEEEARLNTYL